MKDLNNRENRIATEMKIRSVSLPNFSADILDISADGARVKMKGRPASSLFEARIRFGVSLKQQMGAQFEGFARVAWIEETDNGFEAGLQWEKITKGGWATVLGTLTAA